MCLTEMIYMKDRIFIDSNVWLYVFLDEEDLQDERSIKDMKIKNIFI